MTVAERLCPVRLASLVHLSSMEFEVVSTNRAALSVIEGTAPRTARMAAARGALPLPQADLLEVLVHLADTDDLELAETARNTLRGQDNLALEGLFKTEAVAPKVLAHFTKAPGLSRSL